ncbi:MAG: sugar phosphate isomerase/epimerase [Acidobacteria bacterium]|jgi:sugar phosphate isomerase/epimerase|nr:sugar phosphate isomerase/epimerase [Acidobacteriota bacterium]
MTTRRSFLGAVAGGLGAAVAGRRLGVAGEASKPPLGLQLYSLREALAKDLPGTLAQIKGWGIDEVESAGFYGRTASEFAAELKKAGLECPAMHIGYDQLGSDIDEVIKDAEVVGATTIVNPYLPHADPSSPATREEMLRAAADFAKWSKRLRSAGLRFGYHTHGQEFGPAPEGTLFDVFAEQVGPEVGFEFDIFWIAAGGADPLALMKEYEGRVWYTHLKDMAEGAKEKKYGPDTKVVLGTGKFDIPAIVKAGLKAGVEIHFIEDESAAPMAQIPQSIEYYEALKI